MRGCGRIIGLHGDDSRCKIADEGFLDVPHWRSSVPSCRNRTKRSRLAPPITCRTIPPVSTAGDPTVSQATLVTSCSQELCSVYDDGEQEALRYKWIESEKAGHDLGETAIRRWVQNHWWGYLRARWLEHLQGKRFWVELDRGDFGLLQRTFHDNTLLLDRILDRLKAGQENLDILNWAHAWGIPSDSVIEVLEALDINSRRLAHRFDPQE